MSYAVLEQSLADLSMEQLARAFERMPSLTKQDAGMRAKDAAGVLATNLSESDARILRAALAAEGIQTLVVDQGSLPALPKAKALRRGVPQADGLLIYDPLGRVQRIAWSSVTLLAVGNVSEVDFKRARVNRELMLAARAPVALADLDAKQSVRLNLMLEVLLSCEPRRLCVEGNIFTYEYLGAARSNRSADNFVAFVRDMIRGAKTAIRNRGADMLRTDPPKAMTYPSRHAFEQEIVWQLWFHKKALVGQSR